MVVVREGEWMNTMLLRRCQLERVQGNDADCRDPPIGAGRLRRKACLIWMFDVACDGRRKEINVNNAYGHPAASPGRTLVVLALAETRRATMDYVASTDGRRCRAW